MKNLIIKNTKMTEKDGIASFDGTIRYSNNNYPFCYIPAKELLFIEKDFEIPFNDYTLIAKTIKNFAEYSFDNAI